MNLAELVKGLLGLLDLKVVIGLALGWTFLFNYGEVGALHNGSKVSTTIKDSEVTRWCPRCSPTLGASDVLCQWNLLASSKLATRIGMSISWTPKVSER